MSKTFKFVLIVILPLLSSVPIYYYIIYFKKKARLKLFEIRANAVAAEICFRRVYWMPTFELCCAVNSFIEKCQQHADVPNEIYQAYLEGNFREFVYLVFAAYAEKPTYSSTLTFNDKVDILEYCVVTPYSRDFSYWWQPNYLKDAQYDGSTAGAYATIAVFIEIVCMYIIVGFVETLMG